MLFVYIRNQSYRSLQILCESNEDKLEIQSKILSASAVACRKTLICISASIHKNVDSSAVRFISNSVYVYVCKCILFNASRGERRKYFSLSIVRGFHVCSWLKWHSLVLLLIVGLFFLFFVVNLVCRKFSEYIAISTMAISLEGAKSLQ